jgi:peroxiredoxin
MLPLGTPAPHFALLDTVSGAQKTWPDIRGSAGTVVMFLCNHCPFVKHIESELPGLARDYMTQGVGWVAISANDAQNYPEDGPDAMAANAKRLGYPFPYLYDADQSVARAFDAACTPDFYVFDAQDRLVYRGQLDGARPSNDIPVDGADLRAALNALLAGQPPLADQQPSIGCNIKWKSA